MLHFQKTGKGQNLILFIHGNSQSSEIWDSVTTYKELNENYQLVTVDLPGHGKSFRSAEPAKDYSIQGLAQHIKDFIESTIANKYVVTAHSLATNLIGEIISSLKNCNGLCLLAPCIIGGNIDVSIALKQNQNLAAAFSENPSDKELKSYTDDMVCNLQEDKKNKWIEIFRNTDPLFRAELIKSIAKSEWTNEINNLDIQSCPIAIVYGKEDSFINTSYLDEVITKKWRNEILLIDDAAHCLQLDQPEKTARLIKEFCNDCFI